MAAFLYLAVPRHFLAEPQPRRNRTLPTNVFAAGWWGIARLFGVGPTHLIPPKAVVFTTFRAILLDGPSDRLRERLPAAELDPAAPVAMVRSDDASAQFIEQFWLYLYRLACVQLGSRYAAKLDPSDLVQQTFLDAHQKLAQFRGTTQREQAAWLRRIFANNLSDVLRDFTRQKRSLTREQSSDGIAACLDEHPDTRAEKVEEDEQLYRLSWALSQLPELQRRAIELHHLRGLPLAQTAQDLQRTPASVAGLIRRGMAQLRDLLVAPSP